MAGVLVAGESIVATYDGPVRMESQKTRDEKLAGFAKGMSAATAVAQTHAEYGGFAGPSPGSEKWNSMQSKMQSNIAASQRKIPGPAKQGKFDADKVLVTNFRLLAVSGDGVVFEAMIDPDYLMRVYGEKCKKAQELYAKEVERAKKKGFLGSIKEAFAPSEEAKEQYRESAAVMDDTTSALVGIKKEKPLLGGEHLELTVRSFDPSKMPGRVYLTPAMDRPWMLKFNSGAQAQLDSVVQTLAPKAKTVAESLKNVVV